MSLFRKPLLLLAVLGAVSCGTTTAPTVVGIDIPGMDKSIAPGDDFNGYTNGTWIKNTPIPADKSSYGIWQMLNDNARDQMRKIDESSENPKINDFYSTYMDEAGIEAKGVSPLKPGLDAIAAIANRKALNRELGSEIRSDVDPMNNTNFQTPNIFGVWIAQGLNDPSRNYPYLLQGGIEMPDRDYYISTTPQMTETRKKYQTHVENVFRLAGFADPAAHAARAFALETKIANAHATRVESEDVKGAVEWKRADFPKNAPGIDWDVLLTAAALNDAPVFIVWHPKPVHDISALVASEPLDAWKDWLVLHLVERSSRWLPKPFVEESFNFYGATLSGTKQMRPRWQRGVDYVNEYLGDAAGQLYVKHYFPPENKAKVQAMVKDLIAQFGKRIDALTWMAPETKAKAKEKLATLRVGVGYGEKWRDDSGLQIVKGDALGNAERAGLFEYRHQLAKLREPVDPGEWWMTPQTVNAVNLPLQNALNFPAAIMQPPFFDVHSDNAHNYGAIGAVIGHEISHSFDDQGSQFDAQGRMVNWWTKADLDHFRAAGEALAAQFDTYKPFPDLSVNGHQTLSENIADIAGLMTAYDAYHSTLNGRSDATKDGFTGDQRFFISFGQSWRSKDREPLLRMLIATDGHAPNQYRADTVRNVDGWYAAFGVHAGQKLFLEPPNRVRVW